MVRNGRMRPLGALLLALLLAACGREAPSGEAGGNCAGGAPGPARATSTAPPAPRFPTAGIPGPERDGGYARADTVRPGESLTYYAGPGAPEGETTLSRQEIFWDRADGLRFTYGYDEVESRFAVRCGSSPVRDGVWGHGPARRNRELGTVTVRFDCRGTPERIAVQNGSSVPIRVERIATFILRAPRAADTDERDDLLPPGGSIVRRDREGRADAPVRGRDDVSGGGLRRGRGVPLRAPLGVRERGGIPSGQARGGRRAVLPDRGTYAYE